MNYRDICEEYFVAFSNKNLKKLEEMFHEDILLRDWEISRSGKKEVLAANKNIFDSCDNILVTVETQGVDHTPKSSIVRVYNEIKISIDDGSNVIFVVDVLDLDSNTGLIRAVRAFKG